MNTYVVVVTDCVCSHHEEILENVYRRNLCDSDAFFDDLCHDQSFENRVGETSRS